MATHPLRQGADSGHTQLRAHPGHKPIKSLWAQASEHLNGHLYADAVVEPARLKNVRKRQGKVTLMPSVGVAVKVVALGKQQLTSEIQQLGGVLTLMLPPVVESRRAGDFLRQALIVEVEKSLVISQNTVGALTTLHLSGVFKQLTVALNKSVAGVPAPLHQPGANEHFPRSLPGGVGTHTG